MEHKTWGRCVLAGAWLFAASCAKSKDVLPGDDKVLARVDEAVVTAYDLEQSLARTFAAEARAELDEDTRKNVLQSLVTSRALALAREKELTARERAELDRKVAGYREEQLVLQYLAAHSAPAAPSSESIEAYYREHVTQFGARERRRYELLTSERELSPSERDALLKEMSAAGTQADWAAWTAMLRKRGYPLLYSAGRDDEPVLHASLRERLSTLSPGQSSDLTFLQGRPYLLRVTGIEQTEPLPLDSVRASIAKTLAPLEMRVALQRAERMVLPHVHVSYQN